MDVKIYTTPTCQFCAKTKEFFKENNIEFKEVNVVEDQDAARTMIEKTGQQGVPVTVIDDKWDEAIIGFDENKLKEKLNIAS